MIMKFRNFIIILVFLLALMFDSQTYLEEYEN